MRADDRMVYIHCQWTDNRGWTAERMTKRLLKKYIKEGLIFPDYELIGIIEEQGVDKTPSLCYN